jgi:hypothetical protein
MKGRRITRSIPAKDPIRPIHQTAPPRLQNLRPTPPQSGIVAVPMKKYYASVCVTVRNDLDLLRLWLPYYFLIGFDHIYLIDNKSTPSLLSYPFVKKYVDDGKITYYYESRDNWQEESYNYILNTYRSETTWMMICDTDEFMVLHKDSDIKDFLRRYENYGSVCICWYLFGANGHLTHQINHLESYITRFPKSCHYKTIVYTDRSQKQLIHETIAFVRGFYAVDEAYHKVHGPYALYQATDVTQLNHYVTRSRGDFQKKLDRNFRGSPNQITFFNDVQETAIIQDTSILSMLERISPNWKNIIDPIETEHAFQTTNFDPEVYKELYSDMKPLSDADAYSHYLIHGQKEKRLSGYDLPINFDVKSYRESNQLEGSDTVIKAHYLLSQKGNM